VTRQGRLLNMINEGECFGEMAYIRGGEVPRNATVDSVTELLLAKFRPDAFSKMSLGAQLYLTRALARKPRRSAELANTRIAAVISARGSLRDDMKIDWDVPVEMDDRLVLRADVFRPAEEGRYPAILSYGPLRQGLAFREGYKTAWEIMARDYPDAVAGSSNQYANWGGGRSGKVGARRLRLRARRFARRRTLAGYLCHNNAREKPATSTCASSGRRRKPGRAEKSA